MWLPWIGVSFLVALTGAKLARVLREGEERRRRSGLGHRGRRIPGWLRAYPTHA